MAEGIYERYGLDVEIRMGGPGIDNQQLIAAGAIDMALGSNSFFPLNLVQAGAPVVAVMASFQKDPQVLMTHPRDDVNAISDMKGKPIMIGSASVNTFWVWLKAKHGFTDDQMRPYTFNMAPFLVDPEAIQQGYLSSEPFLVEREGITPEVYLLADDGYPSYSAMVLVPQEMIDEKPEVVQAFVNASIEGWYSYLYGDPSPANALIKADNPDMDDETIRLRHRRDEGVRHRGQRRCRNHGHRGHDRRALGDLLQHHGRDGRLPGQPGLHAGLHDAVRQPEARHGAEGPVMPRGPAAMSMTAGHRGAEGRA